MDLKATQFQAVDNGWIYTFTLNPIREGWSVMCRRVGDAPIPPMTKMWTTEGWTHSLRKVGGSDVYFSTPDDAIAALTNPEDQ